MGRVEDPIILALDIAERERLIRLARRLQGEVQTVKLGLEAYTRCGPNILREMRGLGFRVFADLKLHDIPNTVRGAVKALVEWGVDMFTVHISGGGRMLKTAVEAAREEAQAAGLHVPLVLGVTVLTSLDEVSLRRLGWTAGVEDTVLGMARLGMECGLDGLVSSPWELTALRRHLGKGPLLVTPGIRLPGTAVHDQVRTATPREALEAGADYLVVGRAVTADPDPLGALQALRRSAGL